MTKQQFNVRIPDLTREQIDRLSAGENLTAGEVVMIAVDRFYREREGKMDQVRHIEIEYSEDGMWGADGPDGYDIRASYDRFEEQLTRELAEDYPEAEIVVHHTENDRIRIDGWAEGEHEDGPRIAHIVGQVFAGYEWLVEEGSE